MYKVTWWGRFHNKETHDWRDFKITFIENDHDEGTRTIQNFVEAKKEQGWELETNAVTEMTPIH